MQFSAPGPRSEIPAPTEGYNTRRRAALFTAGDTASVGAYALFTAEHGLISQDIPRNYEEAVSSPDSEMWLQAMASELDSLDRNETFLACHKPADRKAIKTKWVFALKYKPNGSIDRAKARLVAQGFHQMPGIDVFDTYSPVAAHVAVRFFLGWAAAKQCDFIQADCVTAFLNASMDEELYVLPPPGFHVDGDLPDLRALKSLYGFKQSPRNWDRILRTTLTDLDLIWSNPDTCLYRSSERALHVIVIVDDMCTATLPGHRQRAESLYSKIAARYAIKVIGNPQRFIGWEISYNQAKGIVDLSMSHRSSQMLERYGFSNARPLSLPAVAGPCSLARHR